MLFRVTQVTILQTVYCVPLVCTVCHQSVRGELAENALELEHCALVAQLDRASAFEAEGRGLDSLRARHFPSIFKIYVIRGRTTGRFYTRFTSNLSRRLFVFLVNPRLVLVSLVAPQQCTKMSSICGDPLVQCRASESTLPRGDDFQSRRPLMATLDLRPLSLGEILDRTFTLYRSHFALFLGITAIPQLLVLALQLTQLFLAGSPRGL